MGYFFERSIKCRLRIEPNVVSNADERVVFIAAVLHSFLKFLNAISIDEIKKVFVKALINHFGENMRLYFDLIG